MENKIKDKILFIIEEENHAWSSYHYLYLITDKGDLYKHSVKEKFNLKLMTKEEIDNLVKSLEVKFLRHLDDTKISKMITNCENIKIDSESYCAGVGFDAGCICYYAFNLTETKNPISIGMRGNMTIHSKNKYEEEISSWIDDVLEI